MIEVLIHGSREVWADITMSRRDGCVAAFVTWVNIVFLRCLGAIAPGPVLRLVPGIAMIRVSGRVGSRGKGATEASCDVAVSNAMKHPLTPTLTSKRKWPCCAIALRFRDGLVLAFVVSQCMWYAVTPILSLLLPVRDFSFFLSIKATRSMYHLTLFIGCVGVIRNDHLERLDVIILVVNVVISCDSRLDKLECLLMDGFVDNGCET